MLIKPNNVADKPSYLVWSCLSPRQIANRSLERAAAGTAAVPLHI